jgi:hypothetical protein
VDFGREAAARAAERFLFLIPPFTPAACWWARTIAESMACSSSAGGPREASVSNAASQTPSWMLLRTSPIRRLSDSIVTDRVPLPYRSGISRQDAPVRRTQNAVDRSSPVRNGGTAFAPIGEQWVENTPFRVRQIASTQCRLLKKGSPGIIPPMKNSSTRPSYL